MQGIGYAMAVLAVTHIHTLLQGPAQQSHRGGTIGSQVGGNESHEGKSRDGGNESPEEGST